MNLFKTLRGHSAHDAQPEPGLRYLRQPEPLPGYDALDGDGVVDALAGVDVATLKSVREYERKMQSRAIVLQALTRGLHESSMPDMDPPSVVGNGLPVRSALPSPRT